MNITLYNSGHNLCVFHLKSEIWKFAEFLCLFVCMGVKVTFVGVRAQIKGLGECSDEGNTATLQRGCGGRAKHSALRNFIIRVLK